LNSVIYHVCIRNKQGDYSSGVFEIDKNIAKTDDVIELLI